MMPHFRLTVVTPAGVTVTYWTQDPEGLGRRYRDGGCFVSTYTPREDPPRCKADPQRKPADWPGS